MNGARILNFFATGGGLGRSPIVPGTFGTLPGIPLAWAVNHLPWPWQAAVCAALAVICVPICDAGEKIAGVKDPHVVVADEYLTFPLTLIGLPFIWPVVVFAFATHRVLDILKPFPANQLQALPGGLHDRRRLLLALRPRAQPRRLSPRAVSPLAAGRLRPEGQAAPSRLATIPHHQQVASVRPGERAYSRAASCGSVRSRPRHGRLMASGRAGPQADGSRHTYGSRGRSPSRIGK